MLETIDDNGVDFGVEHDGSKVTFESISMLANMGVNEGDPSWSSEGSSFPIEAVMSDMF